MAEEHLDIEVKRISEDVSPLTVRALEYRIVDQGSMNAGVEYLGQIKAALDRVDTTRKFFTGPLREIIKKYDAQFAPLIGSLEDAEAALKNEMKRYRESLPKDEVPPPSTSRTDNAKATFVKRWKFEIVDPDAVPREYLTTDDKKIGKVVTAGIRSIPGVRIYETEEVRGSYA